VGKRLGVDIELVPFAHRGKLADAVKAGAWDVAFSATSPSARATSRSAPPYLEIEATYLVPAGSDIARSMKSTGRALRIATRVNSAYDLVPVAQSQARDAVRATRSRARTSIP